MLDGFEYEIKNKTLIIKECPNNILNYYLTSSILNRKDIKKVIVCDGIEKIDVVTFSRMDSLESVALPSTLSSIGDDAFAHCKSLKKVNIPKNVTYIGANAFLSCRNLKSINIPGNVTQISPDTFAKCINLKKVAVEEGVKNIANTAFSECYNLKKIKLPNSIAHLGCYAFDSCKKLKKINIPEGVEEINGTFNKCINLRKVRLPNSLKIIDNHAFNECKSLRRIKFPSNLNKIGYSAFSRSQLFSIDIPESVTEIGNYAFWLCSDLMFVKLHEGLKEIGDSAFCKCTSLISVDVPDTVSEIKTEAFKGCSTLVRVKLSPQTTHLRENVFKHCRYLRIVEIPEGIQKIELDALQYCDRLEELHFPSSLKYFTKSDDFNMGCETTKLKRIFIKDNGEEKEINVSKKRFVKNTLDALFLYDSSNGKYGFYREGKYIEFDETFFHENKKVKYLVQKKLLREKNYINAYYWLNKKIIPSAAVIKTMPIEDIDNFFVNKNCNQWAKLVKEANFKDDDVYVESFFKLCYVLGVFSESTFIRDKAVEFIRENIINKMDKSLIHSSFDGFKLSNGFDKEYAEFFIKYYNDNDFMIYVDEDGVEENLLCASYNNFKNVKRIYPNRTIHTNRRADLLLPIHVMNAVNSIQYDYIDEGNEEFAGLIGRYGYSNSQFEMLQEWYNKAKDIKEEMKLFISKDEENQGIRYELLKKDDPRCAILGNITNYCQVVDGAGEECVEYGMTMPNSGFITFNYKDRIIGQAWVWYDEPNQTVCLDNIEIPRRYLEKINENKQIQKSFIKCLFRIQENVKNEMNKKGLKVKKVTIGKGFNDLQDILKKEFETIEKANMLSGYNGYTDARRQYEIKKR